MDKVEPEAWQFATQAVHAGERGEAAGAKPTVTPIYSTVSYVYDEMAEMDAVFGGERAGYVYHRYGSPTNAAFERTIATLEGGAAAIAYASGMAAVHAAVLACGVSAGDHVVASRDIYGATFSLLGKVFSTLGCRVSFVDIADLSSVEQALAADKTRLLLCETISNPLLRVADLPALVQLARAAGARFVVDSTFTTPYMIRPLQHGADLVVHSATKYLGGHGDVTAGVVVMRSDDLVGPLADALKIVGGVLGPFEAWLVNRGIKTLPLRMRQQCANAATIADWLAAHPKVARVNYPGLPSHPQHGLATRLFPAGTFGGMVSFDLKEGTREAVFRLFEALRICRPATTLGDVYTLLLYPAMSSHRALTPDERRATGIGEGLVRLSAGIEDIADLLADLERALAAA